jgi:hypothetical protein
MTTGSVTAGILLVLLGSLAIAQVTAGQALQRLGIVG